MIYEWDSDMISTNQMKFKAMPFVKLDVINFLCECILLNTFKTYA